MIAEIKKVSIGSSPFPTQWQTVLFHSYGYVPAKRIADVLHCEVSTVEREADRLGLAAVPMAYEMGMRSYITLIRRLWYLLPYEQLTELLGISREELEKRLIQDDFLAVKLGSFKPFCQDVRYTPLSHEDLEKTVKLSSSVIRYVNGRKAAFFDFFSQADQRKALIGTIDGKRIVHGYLSPCGDPFAVDSESYMPDSLLASYQEQGINGIWLHGLLSALSPYPFDETFSVGYEARRGRLRELIERCASYGIKIYLYMNEPRSLPTERVGKYGNLIGHRERGQGCLCLSLRAVQKYLYEAVKDLLEAVPDLGGLITITMSENPTHCRYRTETTCPHCREISAEYSAARVNNILLKAIRDSGSQTELIANLWGWSSFMKWSDEQILRGIDLLDPAISVMCVSEYDLPIVKGGIESRIIDYSISNPGPSPITKTVLRYAAGKSHRVYAKIQINNSWECSAVPYLPVYDLVYQHLVNLQDIGVKNYMLTWTLGGYPSPMMGLVTAYAAQGDSFCLDAWYETVYGEKAATVHQAVLKFCEGFRAYPFSLDHLYLSPQTWGPGNQWHIEPDEKHSTMVCYAFDDYEHWISPYPYDIYCSQYEKLLSYWKEGLVLLEPIADDPVIQELLAFAQVAAIHWEFDVLHTRYAYEKQRGEQGKKRLVSLAKRAFAITEELLSLVKADSRIGYEASNHYYYQERILTENLLQLQTLF